MDQTETKVDHEARTITKIDPRADGSPEDLVFEETMSKLKDMGYTAFILLASKITEKEDGSGEEITHAGASEGYQNQLHEMISTLLEHQQGMMSEADHDS